MSATGGRTAGAGAGSGSGCDWAGGGFDDPLHDAMSRSAHAIFFIRLPIMPKA
jgi:hypothetical protein